jgi:hypothetical protein
MRRRKLLVALAGLAVVVAAGVVVLCHGQPHAGVNPDNYSLIRIGMDRREVFSLFGVPPFQTNIEHGRPGGPEELTHDYWRVDDVVVRITTDNSGKVRQKVSGWDRELGPVDRIIHFAQRQWHRWFP